MPCPDAPKEDISIHAPRTGSDGNEKETQTKHIISIHAPRTGSDMLPIDRVKPYARFQSTLPARGATQMDSAERADYRISIHAPRTGSDVGCLCCGANDCISIHAPRTGSDLTVSIWKPKTRKKFQSTLPARGATRTRNRRHCGQRNFNPRSPHGERQDDFRRNVPCNDFNPRSPHGERRVWRADDRRS